jgi:hypothetical protein
MRFHQLQLLIFIDLLQKASARQGNFLPHPLHMISLFALQFPHSFMQWWFYAHETRQKTIKNALFYARLLILPEKMNFSLK